jgi:outer membrane protein assembly factor BamD (BamD/ComL family)
LSGGATDIAANSPDSLGAEQAAAGEPVDPAEAEFIRIDQQIPRTDEQRGEALKKIEDAYFRVGDIYYFDLLEKNNAEKTYEKLLARFPESEYTPEVLYKLYLIAKEYDPVRAGQYADRLVGDYPFSTFARILANPDYLLESSQTAEKQKALYKEAYSSFESGNYIDANLTVEEGLALGETMFTPNLQLLKVLVIGGMEDIATYQAALNEFMRVNPDSELLPYARKLLETTRKFEENKERQLVIRYTPAMQEPHYFVMIYKRTEPVSEIASSVLEDFNRNYFEASELNISELDLNEGYGMTIVSDFDNGATAQQYHKTFIDRLETFGELRNHKYNKFVITSDNFNIFYRTKGLNEYLQFFEKNYQLQAP